MLCLFCLLDLILYIPVNNFSVMSGQVFLGQTSTKQWINVSCSREQHSDFPSRESQTSNPSIPSLTLYQLSLVVLRVQNFIEKVGHNELISIRHSIFAVKEKEPDYLCNKSIQLLVSRASCRQNRAANI